VKLILGVLVSLKERLAWEEGTVLHLTSSVIAGIVTTTASNPVDVIKTRIMNTGGGLGEVAVSIFKEHGVFGFFRGWTASYSRLGPHTIIIMNIYELLNSMVGLKGV
jgi:hypothetical protein